MTNVDSLRIYKLSKEGVKKIYQLTKDTTLRKDYSLCDQIRRASISISANIAEGYGRRTKKDFANFVSVSMGSCNEVICFLELINDLYNIPVEEEINFYKQLANQIWSFRKSLLQQS